MKRKVDVVTYDHHWKEGYRREAERLKSVFQSNCIAIHHIGSTSIPNMCAKPIIDLLIEVEQIEVVEQVNEAMKALGYEAKGENGISDRRFFQKGGLERTHHVHVFPQQHVEVQRHINFRDYLIFHPQQAQEYARLKIELANKYLYDIERYIEGKDAFIKNIDKLASKWKVKE